MSTHTVLTAIIALALSLAGSAEALPLRIRPRLSLRTRPRIGLGPSGASLTARPRNALAQRRRARVERQEATLGSNPPPKTKDTGLENPDHIRNQDELLSRGEALAREAGDEIVGPAVGYYRTSHGRLVRVTPNAGTGNLRQAARLKNGETLSRLEQVGFATRRGNRLLWATSDGSASRLGLVRGSNWVRATGGIMGTAALLFGRDLFRWIGIRNGAEAIQEKVVPEEPEGGPEIVIDEHGQIHIDGDGDGQQDLEVQGREEGVIVTGQDGPPVVVDQGTIRSSQDEDGQNELRIDPQDTEVEGPYGLP